MQIYCLAFKQLLKVVYVKVVGGALEKANTISKAQIQ